MTDPFDYKGVLAPYMKEVIHLKEACGFAVMSMKWNFKEFDEFTVQYGLKEPVITKELTDAWIFTRQNDCARTFYQKCSRIAQLSKHMNRQGKNSYVIPLPTNCNDRFFVPYIFSEEQIRNIFCKADGLLRESHRKDDPIISMPCLFRLLYSTGLRITEALSLRNMDVDLRADILRVGTWGSSKNGEERLVPICGSLKENLRKYIHYRALLPVRDVDIPEHPFFVKLNGDPVSSPCAYKWFVKTYISCGIAYKGDRFGPRIHDLRHTMATHSLTKMIREGLDAYAALPLLAACLGHKNISATEQYVRLTCSEYPDLINQCSDLNNFIYGGDNEIE